jgi:uncharacterized protein (TIGR02444 family)
LFPDSPFWDFSLRLYARPGVAESCLRLQDRHGIDVNVLFCCLWLGMTGQDATRRDIARMIAGVRTLHEQVVKPLRVARTALKRMLATADGALLPATGALRAAIKKSELDAEHLEQILLAATRPRRTRRARLPAGRALAEANAVAYFAVHRARLGRGDHADLAGILAALDTHPAVELAGGDSPPLRLGRRRPLARAGGAA